MRAAPATRPEAQLDAFAGTVAHDATTVDPAVVTATRVALIGDPRRLVRAAPHLADRASTLKLFQTEGVWVLPFDGRLGRAIDAVVGPVPSTLRWRVAAAVAACNLRRSVRDGWTRRHLQPQISPSSATAVRSSGYYRTLRRSDVELISWPIATVVPAGIRTADGVEHHVDVIVVA
jgi:cation diffusion facilitator CzcD-associated flavoprotein CzcO